MMRRYQGFGESFCLHLQGSTKSAFTAISQNTGASSLPLWETVAPLQLDNRASPPPIIIDALTSRSRNRIPECCLVAEERKPNGKKSHRIWVFFKPGATHPPPTHCEVCGCFIYATGESLISIKWGADHVSLWLIKQIPCVRHSDTHLSTRNNTNYLCWSRSRYLTSFCIFTVIGVAVTL